MGEISRTLVYKTLEFENPARTPRQLWILPWAINNYPRECAAIKQRYPDDIVYAKAILKQQPQTCGDAFKVGYYVDEWGCRFENKQNGVIGEVKEPLIKTLAGIQKVRLPQECLTVNTEMVDQFCKKSSEFVLGACCPCPFERLQFLRGTENLMIDIAMQFSEFYQLAQIVHNFYLEEMHLWAKTKVDGLWFKDDWGTQRSLLISPQSWRKIFKPMYKEYIDLAHSHGKKIFMHSDGYIFDIIPDLVEMGLDAINSQIFCMSVKDIGKCFAGKITFWGEIDRQHLLPYGSTDDIQAAVQMLQHHLYRNGGVIAP